ncbi:VOC family protein [Alphaproteobacteria bacterium KMM 3653]|uniref:VOC family protein n=1 Tax=Harenicola maris TaxID=2841044 RepID=A0AAP2G2V2_9RHOB|nr:VOC family protein [Harenicola maris]
MRIEKLDHVNLRTTQLEAMIEWYVEVLGMTNGKRPGFPFPGAWIYAGDAAVVHLVGIEGEAAVGSEVSLKMEHVAFRAVGAEAFEARLKARGARYQKAVIEEVSTVAFNVWDPDGNHVHVDFVLGE